MADSYLFLEKAVQFVSAVVNPQSIRRIDDPDQRIRLLKVVPPVRPQRFLAANVPCSISMQRSMRRSGRLTDVQFISGTSALANVGLPWTCKLTRHSQSS